MTRLSTTKSSAVLHGLAGSGLFAVLLACGGGITLLCAELLRYVGQPVMLPILRVLSE